MASPQALTVLVGATSPTTNTAGAGFAANYAKLAGLNAKERKALQVVSLLYYYQTVTDYRTQHGLLISDAMTFSRGISNFDYEVGTTLTDWNASYNQLITLLGTAAAAGDIADLIKRGSDFRSMPELTLNKIIVFLRAQLGV